MTEPERRELDLRRRWEQLSPLVVLLVALVLAVIVGGLVMLATGANPFVAYAALLDGAVGGPQRILAATARATPFIGGALALAFAFRAGLFNIGAESQILIGALVGAWVGTWGWMEGMPALVAVPFLLAAGALGGGVWGGIPGVLKARTGAHEVITTIMLNFIGLRLTEYLVFSRDPVFLLDVGASVPHTRPIPGSARLPELAGSVDLHSGFLIGVAMCVVMWFVIERTTTGFEIRAVGLNAHAARYAGMSVDGTIVLSMAVSGAFAGIAGIAEVMGTNGFLQPGVFRNIGFDSIAIALLARANPRWIVPAALLWGALLSGAPVMQLRADLSIDLVRVVQALILLFVAADVVVRRLLGLGGERGPQLAAGWGS